jgi:hypothetical protein
MKTVATILIVFVLSNVAVLFCATQLLPADADVAASKGFDVTTWRYLGVGFAVASSIGIAAASANFLRRSLPWIAGALFMELTGVAIFLAASYLNGVAMEPIASVATGLVVFMISNVVVSWWAIVCGSFSDFATIPMKDTIRVIAFQVISCAMLAAISAFILYNRVVDVDNASWAKSNEWIVGALFIELVVVSFVWAYGFVLSVRKAKQLRRVSAD